MIRNALLFLTDVAFALVVYPLLLRFWMQVLRAPFRNPLGQALQALTNWIVKPLRRIIPGWFGIDFATLLPAIVFRWLWLLSEFAIAGTTLEGNLLLLVALCPRRLHRAARVDVLNCLDLGRRHARDPRLDPIIQRLIPLGQLRFQFVEPRRA